MNNSAEQSLPFFRRLLRFGLERFNPLSHFVMITLFVACHFFAARLGEHAVVRSIGAIVALSIGTAAFFFKLRVYDEIKDYEVDRKFKPTRPLARGLVTIAELKRVIVACIIVELAAFGLVSQQAACAIAVAIVYSLLMYKEFFIGPILRPHLTTYAVTHTFVSAILSLTLLSTLHGRFFWQETRGAFLFAFANWCLFNIFEFGRKTYATSEERPGIDSYSSIFGRYGAAALSVAMAAITAAVVPCISGAPRLAAAVFLWPCSALLAGTGIVYAAANRSTVAHIFRVASSVFIIVVFAGLAVLFAAFTPVR
jgi:4-hydroxybenzoate polyprenyltransferase